MTVDITCLIVHHEYVEVNSTQNNLLLNTYTYDLVIKMYHCLSYFGLVDRKMHTYLGLIKNDPYVLVIYSA